MMRTSPGEIVVKKWSGHRSAAATRNDEPTPAKNALVLSMSSGSSIAWLGWLDGARLSAFVLSAPTRRRPPCEIHCFIAGQFDSRKMPPESLTHESLSGSKPSSSGGHVQLRTPQTISLHLLSFDMPTDGLANRSRSMPSTKFIVGAGKELLLNGLKLPAKPANVLPAKPGKPIEAGT